MIEAATLGTLVRDAEGKISKNGKQYLRFTLIIGSGDDAQFLNCMIFGAAAEALLEDAPIKGDRLYVEGRISLDQWTTKDGEARTSLQLMGFYGRRAEIGQHKKKKPKGDDAPGSDPRPEPPPGDFHSDPIPF
jgi:single-stranded DNA-binding protein